MYIKILSNNTVEYDFEQLSPEYKKYTKKIPPFTKIGDYYKWDPEKNEIFVANDWKLDKSIKLAELEAWFEDSKNYSKVNLKGFGYIDAGYKYLANAESLVSCFEFLPQKLFRMYDDSFKTVTLQDLKNIVVAIQLAGVKIHQIKWQIEQQIAQAQTQEDLDNIQFATEIEIELPGAYPSAEEGSTE